MPSKATKIPADSNVNRPRNLLITDATRPFTFTFFRYGSPVHIKIRQTPDDEVWPGGALWDIGVLLAQLLVITTSGASSSCTSTTTTSSHKLGVAATRALSNIKWKDAKVLELGCGVGLTGLVAAALGAELTILTDLKIVVDKVTQPNVRSNVSKSTGGNVVAAPLCWGDERDENAVRKLLSEKRQSNSSPGRRRRQRRHQPSITALAGTSATSTFPDLILIGDVAYQHFPGAPSHFDALVSTLLKFVGDRTLVLFGTRMRMPASSDLLDLFSEHLEQIGKEIPGQEVNPALNQHPKHNITIHLFRKRTHAREMDS